MVRVPPGGLYPCVGLAAAGDAVRLSPQILWPPDEDTHMSVDSVEEEWLRLHDIRLNGQVKQLWCRWKSLHFIYILLKLSNITLWISWEHYSQLINFLMKITFCKIRYLNFEYEGVMCLKSHSVKWFRISHFHVFSIYLSQRHFRNYLSYLRIELKPSLTDIFWYFSSLPLCTAFISLFNYFLLRIGIL